MADDRRVVVLGLLDTLEGAVGDVPVAFGDFPVFAQARAGEVLDDQGLALLREQRLNVVRRLGRCVVSQCARYGGEQQGGQEYGGKRNADSHDVTSGEWVTSARPIARSDHPHFPGRVQNENGRTATSGERRTAKPQAATRRIDQSGIHSSFIIQHFPQSVAPVVGIFVADAAVVGVPSVPAVALIVIAFVAPAVFVDDDRAVFIVMMMMMIPFTGAEEQRGGKQGGESERAKRTVCGVVFMKGS